MIEYKEQAMPVKFEAKFFCDKCGKEVDQTFDRQEAHQIRFVGGYSSVFGDGNSIECDLCQDCLLSLIGNICRYNPDVYVGA